MFERTLTELIDNRLRQINQIDGISAHALSSLLRAWIPAGRGIAVEDESNFVCSVARAAGCVRDAQARPKALLSDVNFLRRDYAIIRQPSRLQGWAQDPASGPDDAAKTATE